MENAGTERQISAKVTLMEYVWFDIDLETLPPYDIWKPASLKWALTVNWAKVNDLIRNRLSDFPTQSHPTLWKTVKGMPGLSKADREGLWTLYTESIYATPAQISSGGHRLTAMRTQGLRWALGQCHHGDIGVTVDELHAYRS